MSLTLNANVVKKYKAEVFVETGTFNGRGAIFAVYSGFKEVHTIELDPKRAATARKRFVGFPEIRLYEGDSARILPEILARLEKKALIFLDAHSFGKEPPAVPGTRYPLVEELRRLASSRRKDHNILVDDIRSFKLYGTTLDEAKKLLLRVNASYKIAVEPNADGMMDMVGAKL